jgi:hypothetical protein
MQQGLRLVAMAVVFLGVSFAWMVLGVVMSDRSSDQRYDLSGDVAELWGTQMTQVAPTLSLEWQEWETQRVPVRDAQGRQLTDADGRGLTEERRTQVTRRRDEALHSSDLAVDLSLDPRRKGLVWFALYDVVFGGTWTWSHGGEQAGVLVFTFPFPMASGVFDDFHLTVNGEEATDAEPQNGQVQIRVPVQPGETVSLGAGYRSRGADQWTYLPNPNGAVGQVRDLRLTMTTDFEAIDFPVQTLSPDDKQDLGDGWRLTWDFRRLITGHGIGMVMPQRTQPGELAASMSFSAPISLGLFMMMIYVLGLLKGVEVHPVNHLLIAGAFFSFHLLFAYTADHLPVEGAFALSSVVSLLLTISYLRLVTGPRFALVEAGAAQLVYLIGFALAHFFDGMTGLTVTLLGIGTLFALMQLTGRIQWARVFSGDGIGPLQT